MEMTKEQIDELQKLTKDMREKLDKTQDGITKDEVQRMMNDLVDKLHAPKEKKFEFNTEEDVLAAAEQFKQTHAFSKEAKWDKTPYGKQFGGIRGFMSAVMSRDARLTKTMYEGSTAPGGFAVPTEFSSEIITLMNSESILRRIARMLPMSTWKRTIPRQLTDVAVSWVSELGTKGKTGITGEQITQTAKVCAAVIKSSDELLRDSAINLQSFLSELIASAMALEEDRVGFAGGVDENSDPFDGVLYTTGVVDNPMAGASMAADDVVNLIYAIPKKYRTGARFVLNDTALKILIKLQNKNGDFIWSPPTAATPALIWGQQYEETDQLPTDLGDGDDETVILFGNFGKFLYLSPREGMAVKVSQEASDWVDGALDSAYMKDQTWMRFTEAKSIDVALPAAFAKMNVK